MNVCKDDASILIIYTGGTIGMIENPETGSLEAFNFEHLEEHVPELKNLGYKISSIQFDPPMDIRGNTKSKTNNPYNIDIQ